METRHDARPAVQWDMGYDTDVARALRPPSKAPWMLVGLLAAGMAGGGYHFYDQLRRAKSDTQAATDKATAAVASVAVATAAQKELTDKVEKLEGEKTELATAKEELSKEVAAKSGELAQLKGTYDKLEEKMKDEIAKGDIRAVAGRRQAARRPGRQDPVRLGRGCDLEARRGGAGARGRGAGRRSTTSRSRSRATPTRTPISEKLAAQFPTNWELSGARAVNVVRFLAEKAERAGRSGWWPAATASTTRSPATRPPRAARATGASRSC